MPCAQRKNLFVPRSRTVLMPNASSRCLASDSDTPWIAVTGASAMSWALLPSHAFDNFASSPSMMLPPNSDRHLPTAASEVTPPASTRNVVPGLRHRLELLHPGRVD